MIMSEYIHIDYFYSKYWRTQSFEHPYGGLTFSVPKNMTWAISLVKRQSQIMMVLFNAAWLASEYFVLKH